MNGINQFGSFTGFDKEGIETVQSGNWNAGSTWLGGNVPDTSDQAIIKATHTVTLNSSTFAGGISIESGATLDIQANTLHLRSNYKNDGSFIGSGTVRLVGNALQSLSGSSNTNFEILEINNPQGVIINSGEIAIGTRLDVISGNLNTNGRITLLSSSSRTANLGQVLGSLSGSIKAQRHINGVGNDVGWRHLCSPLQSSALSDFKYHPSTYPKGIYFYGFSGSNQNYNWANAYRFSESSAGLSGNFDDGWIAASSITNPISYTIPYTIYTGGVNFPEYDLQVEGIPNVGNQVISGLSLTGTSRWHLIGNPYPSSIDWSAVTRTGIDAVAYVFSETNGGYIATNLLPNPNLIASFQAFFVRVNNATNNITFQENDKVNTDAPFQKSFKNGDRMLMRLTNTRTKRFSPAAVDWIADASAAFDSEYDAYKLYNGYPLPNLGLIPADDTTELQVAADAPGRAVYSYAIRVLTPPTDTMELLFEDLPGSNDFCIRLYDKDMDSTMTISKGFAYRFLLRDTANYARFELSAFDVNASASIDHISCHGAADERLALELPQWTSFNVRWYDAQGSMLKQSLNVNGSDSLLSLLPGNYVVSLSDVNGLCPVFDKNYSVLEPQEVVADFELSADTLFVGDTLQISNRSQGASNFYWSFGDGSIDSSTNPTHVYQWAGAFSFALLSYENNCSDTISRQVKVVQAPLSGAALDKGEDYRVKLRANGIVVSGLSQEAHTIALYDMRGALIFSDAFEGGSYFKEGLSIVPGTYTVKVDSEFTKQISQ